MDSRRPAAIATLLLLAAPAAAQTAPASSQPALDFSSPRATLLSAYRAMRAGNAEAVESCMIFTTPQHAEVFDLNMAQLCAPLRLMHAMEARFGPAARKPFDTSIEKSIDVLLAHAASVEISQDDDNTAVVGEKKAEINPNAETELTGITLKRDGPGKPWKIVASTFPDAGGQMSPRQLDLMRSLRDAIVNAADKTIDRLNR